MLASGSKIASFFTSLASQMLGGITVIHVLDSIVVSKLEGSTTEIPYEIVINDNLDEIGEDHQFSYVEAVLYSGINVLPDGAQKYGYAGSVFYEKFRFDYKERQKMFKDLENVKNGEMTQLEFASKYVNDYADFIDSKMGDIICATDNDTDVKIGGVKIPASRAVTVYQDVYNILSIPDKTITCKAYVTDTKGNKIYAEKTPSPVSPKLVPNKKYASNQELPVEFEVVSGDFEYSNGEYTIKSNSLIRMRANRPNEVFVVHIVAEDGYE